MCHPVESNDPTTNQGHRKVGNESMGSFHRQDGSPCRRELDDTKCIQGWAGGCAPRLS